jgi:hypothetical protein
MNNELLKDFAVKLWGKKLFCKLKVSFGDFVFVLLKVGGGGCGLAGLRGGVADCLTRLPEYVK